MSYRAHAVVNELFLMVSRRGTPWYAVVSQLLYWFPAVALADRRLARTFRIMDTDAATTHV